MGGLLLAGGGGGGALFLGGAGNSFLGVEGPELVVELLVVLPCFCGGPVGLAGGKAGGTIWSVPFSQDLDDSLTGS